MTNPLSHFTTIRRRATVVTLVIVGAAVLAMIGRLASSRLASGVRLEFTGCKRWTDSGNYYAGFQLVNNTTNTIRYPLIRDAGPKDTVALSREGRWRPVQWDASAKGEFFMMHPLKPAGKVSLIVPLISGAPPKQFAVPCQGLPEVRHSALSKRLRRWLAPFGPVLKIEITRPEFLSEYDQMIWCRERIAVPPRSALQRAGSASNTNGAGR